MNAKIIDGKAIAAEHLLALQRELARTQATPKLDVVLLGENPASVLYVRKKHEAAQQIGIQSEIHHLPLHCSEDQLLALITQLNLDDTVHGILIQLPLPGHINTQHIIEAIHPHKDVDGFHPYNLGRLAAREPLLRPCTPYGVIKLLEHEQINLKGINAVVVGASNVVGRPMALELLLKGATVTVCHRFTKNLAEHVKSADLLIACVGKAHLIKADWIKMGAIVIDVGINRLENGKIAGDVDSGAAKRASLITPVPGGVGPMTVAMLMENTYQGFLFAQSGGRKSLGAVE